MDCEGTSYINPPYPNELFALPVVIVVAVAMVINFKMAIAMAQVAQWAKSFAILVGSGTLAPDIFAWLKLNENVQSS